MSDRRSRSTAVLAVILPLALPALGSAASAPPGSDDAPPGFQPDRRWREPVAMAVSTDGSRLYVANRESGTLSVIDVGSGRVASEHEVGSSLSDLALLPDGRHLLAVDEEEGLVVVVRLDGREVDRIVGVTVPETPVGISLEPEGGRAFVSSLWPRSVSVIAMNGEEPGRPTIELVGSVSLPFEPRGVLAVGGGKAIVADAFGGRMAVVDGDSMAVESVRELPGHNIRGLALSAGGDRLLVSHQLLNRAGRTDQNDIHWAAFITSNLLAMPLAAVLDPAADPIDESRLYHLSDVGDGGGDPNGVLVMPDGTIAVALGGVNEVAFGPESASIGHRVSVGRRPVALAKAPGDRRIFVADAFADTVSVVSLEDGAQASSIPLGPHPEPDAVRLGRHLFHDALLSHDGWMSCHSCHTDGHTSGRFVDTLGDDSYGTPKRTPSLLGAGETGPWAWDGSMESIADQVSKSVVSTMRGYPPDAAEASAIEAYIRSLPPAPPIDDCEDDTAIERGSAAFRRLRCDRCHRPPTYTAPGSYDVGLADERGRSEFNPPSLRGVARRPALFHDGRAGSIAEVFEKYGHQLDEPLEPGELEDLIAFLRSL
ncbi:cytochrome c peroxidase [Tautonia sociabilis]|uniref:YVTN family beta-propeller domain-containing protein n=1 Tax=Tautonia sociabilis TaxID=2080755 RepID=A0A432MNS2_9BACT|nr:cytochrome c peroxidase [Tautonia sociabilis]RUL88745.1 YVTN family beta-propeller domain-containing protein [Tautonia sociabilis]